ncbi:hypothetical protein RS030_172577 [Cryptosporidium xiaoi]|uniref:RING-type domain-containing protein n=1 Tax=Cryptosporidium xiaoi TaxID=659607 RepID=A0AAV9Y1F6_9CRYT
MSENPKLTDEDFYEKYPNYDVLISSLDIPNDLKAFEVVCPPRKVGKNKISEIAGIESDKNNLLDESILLNITTLGESDLYADFNCLICFSILRKTMVVKDCMHRFCCECIEKCVRIGLRECPQCRLHISSRRALRNDEIMNTLTLRLFPKAIKFEEKYQELLVERNKRQRIGEYVNSNDKTIEFESTIVKNHGYQLISVHLKPVLNDCLIKSTGNENNIELKLPLYVRLSYIKQYILGKIRLEKPYEKYQIQLYLNKEFKNVSTEDEKENKREINSDSNIKNQGVKIKKMLLECDDEKIENLIENERRHIEYSKKKELFISYKLLIKQ